MSFATTCRLVPLLLGFPILAPLSPGLAEIPHPNHDWSGAQSFEVLRVIDGDTVVLRLSSEETKVRLIGVDTPETVHPQKPVEAYGQEASRFTKNLLLGEEVFVEYESGASRTDKYGRTLAYLYRAPDGLFVNLEIVRQGYGHAYTQYPFQYMELFREYERRAREAGKGLWESGAGTASSVAAPEESQTAEGEDVTVYVTRTGAKYHREGCRYLSRSMIPISLKEARVRYSPCSVCRPPS
jgi:micrococcal nuclease